MRANLGVHGRMRTRERTNMLLHEARRIIKNGHCVTLGPNRGRAHVLCKLFFSQTDEDFFVAFHDERGGKVISVWPLEFLKEYKPTRRQKEVARRRAEGMTDEPLSEEIRSFRRKYPQFSIPPPQTPTSPERLASKNVQRISGHRKPPN